MSNHWKITNTKARNYMEEWMDLHAIGNVNRTEDFIYCTARDRMNVLSQYRISIDADCLGQSNVWQRPDGSEAGWEWVDAIPLGAGGLQRVPKKHNVMTFEQFCISQDLRMQESEGVWSIHRKTGKTLRKPGKEYTGYTSQAEAWADLEKDLVQSGVLTAVK